MHAAGHHFDGHTELLAHLSGAKSSFMLLASSKLSVVHVTTHVSLERRDPARDHRARARHHPRRQRALQGARLCQPAHRRGRAEPALRRGRHLRHRGDRPHQPARWSWPSRKGINVKGPISGDTVFYRALKGEFDLVVAQYHDQGHIPTKLIAFDETVNVSLGLPIRRTSVDHGTAFDIAWKGKASHVNMRAAVAYARMMADRAAARVAA